MDVQSSNVDGSLLSLEQGITVLTLDGGRIGSTELSQLVILDEIFRRLKYDLSRPDLRPWQVFDIILGSGTGGFFAILFGRMKMSVAEVQDAYIRLQQAVLAQEPWTLMQKDESDADLDRFLTNLGQMTGINIDEPLHHENSGTKCAVCTINPNGATHHSWLRSYLVRDHSSPSCTIRQAIMASLADLEHLSSITLGAPFPESFASACHRGFSNLTATGLKELSNAFRHSGKGVATVINIGIGHPGPLTLSKAGPSSHDLLRICMDSERVSEEIERLSTGLAGFFFRFSVAQGLQALAGCDHPTQEVYGHARQYCLCESTSQKFDRAVTALTHRTAVVSCERLNALTGSDAQDPVTQRLSNITARLVEQSGHLDYQHLLTALQPVQSARYNATNRPAPRRSCTENTRVEILRGMHEWAQNPSDHKIYCLNGMAGTGKTTIGYSFSEQLQAAGRLGATFFCSRADMDCSDATRIVPSIAFQLARVYPGYHDALSKALASGAELNFSDLLAGPLQRITQFDGEVIVVIDALDECRDPKPVTQLLDHLWRRAASLPIKFFITFRPEREFLAVLHRKEHISTRFHLHDVEKNIVGADIRLYVKERLESARDSQVRETLCIPSDWPPVEQVNALVEAAGRLFIYAATACEYITVKGNPIERLSSIVSVNQQPSTEQSHAIDLLYSHILSEACDGLEEREFNVVQTVISQVIFLRQPLSLESLAALENRDQSTILLALEDLRSVIHVSEDGETVSILHASFSDYLQDRGRSNNFFLDPRERNALLSLACYRFMVEHLRLHLRLRMPFDGSALADLFQARHVKKDVEPTLAYACEFYLDHCIEGGLSARKPLHDILHGIGFLRWIECASSIRCLDHLVLVLSHKRWSHIDGDLYNLLNQAERFIVANYDILNQCPAEVYRSGLIWAPLKSRLRAHFETLQSEVLPFVVRGLDTDWQWYRTLYKTKDDRPFSAVTFSPDGNLVASGSEAGSIHIWRTRTGKCESIFPGESSVSALAFSSNGSELASIAEDGSLQIYCLVSGTKSKCTLTWSHPPSAFSFMDSDRYIVIAESDRLVIYQKSPLTEVFVARFKDLTSSNPTPTKRSLVAFHPQTSVIAMSIPGLKIGHRIHGYIVRIAEGRLVSKHCLQVKDDYLPHRPLAVGFMPSGQQVVILYDGLMRIWDVGLMPVQDNSRYVCIGDYPISPTTQPAKLTAFRVLPDLSLCIVQIFDKGTQHEIISRRFDSTGTDRNALWRHITGAPVGTTLFSQKSPIISIAMSSPEHELVATCSSNGAICIWDTTPTTQSGSSEMAVPTRSYVEEAAIETVEAVVEILLYFVDCGWRLPEQILSIGIEGHESFRFRDSEEVYPIPARYRENLTSVTRIINGLIRLNYDIDSHEIIIADAHFMWLCGKPQLRDAMKNLFSKGVETWTPDGLQDFLVQNRFVDRHKVGWGSNSNE